MQSQGINFQNFPGGIPQTPLALISMLCTTCTVTKIWNHYSYKIKECDHNFNLTTQSLVVANGPELHEIIQVTYRYLVIYVAIYTRNAIGWLYECKLW